MDVEQEQVNKIPHLSQKHTIEKKIEDKTEEMGEIRAKISKLGTFNKSQLSSFQSKLPVIEAKLNYFKQKISKELEQIAYEYGVEFRYPISRDELGEELEIGKRVRITSSILEGMEEKFEREKEKIEAQLDKHNSLNLLTNLEEDSDKLEHVLKTLMEETEELVEERKKFTEELETIRKDRSAIFIDFVNSLRPTLVTAYQILTQQDDGLIGTVDLHI